MRRVFGVIAAAAGCLALAAPLQAQTAAAQEKAARERTAFMGPNPMSIDFIDVEGGQATLIVSPSGESLLVDAGWPGFEGRDADRIVAAAKLRKVSRIDYLVVTHYHTDHVGGVPQLAAKMPVGTFVDHGDTVEHNDEQGDKLYKAYLDVRSKGKHLQVKPGDTIPIKGIDVRVVTAGGEALKTPLPGGGQPNDMCAAAPMRDPDPSENARSVGIVVTYGAFRFVDLGDLTWNKEKDLACPNNIIGPVDVLLSTHHGLNQSNSPVLVHALHPRAIVMNNGSKKGGSPEAWQTFHDSPGLADLWQIHYAAAGGADHNVSDEQFIANMDETTSYGLELIADAAGTFQIDNRRTHNSKMLFGKATEERIKQGLKEKSKSKD
jgi:competence protein ComEC